MPDNDFKHTLDPGHGWPTPGCLTLSAGADARPPPTRLPAVRVEDLHRPPATAAAGLRYGGDAATPGAVACAVCGRPLEGCVFDGPRVRALPCGCYLHAQAPDQEGVAVVRGGVPTQINPDHPLNRGRAGASANDFTYGPDYPMPRPTRLPVPARPAPEVRVHDPEQSLTAAERAAYTFDPARSAHDRALLDLALAAFSGGQRPAVEAVLCDAVGLRHDGVLRLTVVNDVRRQLRELRDQGGRPGPATALFLDAFRRSLHLTPPPPPPAAAAVVVPSRKVKDLTARELLARPRRRPRPGPP